MTGPLPPTAPASPWLRRPRPDTAPGVRLLCLPHAGGTASLYRAWARLLPPAVEPVLVCPPGREERLHEPVPRDIPAFVDQLAYEVAPLCDRPWAVFGHSMGAVIGHELALRLIAGGAPPPTRVFVSAREAPQFHRPGTVHLLDDDGLAAELARLGGTHPELLAMPEVRQIVLPAVREDYRLVETYAARPAALLPCPVTALYGTEDTEVTAAQAGGWGRWTDGPFELLSFAGGHFYFSEDPGRIVAAVRRRLTSQD
ncbi:thioesterase II family protein [Streptomyces sp. NPDC050560]|uniref:thioesterase II family protein n=1 Tax=Streptomyces sp. NPDC050560 TaxID=3365630 RepID=UPI0037B0ED88